MPDTHDSAAAHGASEGDRHGIHATLNLTRRSFMATGAGAAIAATARIPPARAAPTGIPFGGAIQFEYFDDRPYRQAFLDHCDIVMPMNELKFGLLQRERGQFDFSRSDTLVDFARDNGKASRGHAFLWHSTNPPWVDALNDERDTESVVIDHIERVADHYRGRLASWDVVNEVIAHEPREAGGPLRDTIWRRNLGPRYIPLAFETAARADPDALLVINDYDLEFAGDRYDARRAVMLDLVRQLQDGGLHVDAVGCQAHLYAHFKVDVDALARFKEELEGMGVAFIVTELDVIDFQIRGGVEEQDAAATVVVSDLLDGVLSGRPPLAVVAWGITDRYSWVDDAMPHEDGKPSRPLPLDVDLRPKPWYDAMKARLLAAS
ncbi:endo-1,4-beta-xylanase [Aureimonas mangrovi]|uniref:endo-1,4-beta-xylanase n=1 Tax=Aureimonas mangrovi TaxID=2758041 RepID=UPI00163DE339|nr:endo-1,4-beta-xylanase [Aureimonas mangrovi]